MLVSAAVACGCDRGGRAPVLPPARSSGSEPPSTRGGAGRARLRGTVAVGESLHRSATRKRGGAARCGSHERATAVRGDQVPRPYHGWFDSIHVAVPGNMHGPGTAGQTCGRRSTLTLCVGGTTPRASIGVGSNSMSLRSSWRPWRERRVPVPRHRVIWNGSVSSHKVGT